LYAAARGVAEADRLNSGSGLANMKKRLVDAGGHCEISSVDDNGTRVEMTVAIQASPSPVVVIGRNGKTN
jgi:signal transduction histidine kinase